MDPAQRKRLHDDLKGIIRGELLFDELSRALYRTDASIFEIEPSGVVVPLDAEDLSALVHYAGEHQVPLIPRGAGTNRNGAALGDGLVVDLSVHFRQIRAINADSVEVEAGVPVQTLQRLLAEQGRRLAWDDDHLEGTVGGLIATAPSGVRSTSLGTIREQIRALEVVLDSGEQARVEPTAKWPLADSGPSRLQDIVASTRTLLTQYEELIRSSPRSGLQDHCGYWLRDVQVGNRLNLTQLLAGSEGTLALVTGATLTTTPAPAERAVAMLAFARMESALRAGQMAARTGPTACELLERRLLRLARREPSQAELVPEGAEAVLLVEYESAEPLEARTLAELLVHQVYQRDRLAIHGHATADEAECRLLWQLRQAAFPGLSTRGATLQPVPLMDDVAVPPDRLIDYLPRLQDILRQQETPATFLLHMQSGRVEMFPFVDLQHSRGVDRLWTLADEICSLVLELGGTISAGRGTGLAYMPWTGRQVGPLAAVFREVKGIFDPRYLFNPGKIVAGPDTPVTWPLRRRSGGSEPRPLRLPQKELHWTTTEPVQESLACHGCGACRTEAASQRMCPIFRATHAEAASPRAKANLMRHLLEAGSDPS
ncbi:MAG: FAD-linked oxidase C-terminal domain-containing protein [Gemmataceae bacterium]